MTLALSYYGLAGQPAALEQIPIEAVHAGLRYLADLPHIDKVGVPNQPCKPAETAIFADGGTPAADAPASRQAWSVMLTFLETQ